jgi:adenylosuccinate lyase
MGRPVVKFRVPSVPICSPSAHASIMSDTRPDTLFALTALSPLDGRYASKTEALREWLSEAAFMRHRVTVEIHWLIALSQAGFAEVPRCASRKSSASPTMT